MTLTAALLDPILRANPARPLITFYDDATGERIELSGVTTANWAAKTANLLRDECDVETGTTVAAMLPAHWQTAAVLLGAWWCGAHVVATPAEADWVLCDGDRVDLALAAAPSGGVVALSLDAFGRGLDGLPAGVIDYATEVRSHGDDFVPWEPVDDSAPALDGRSIVEVLDTARRRAGSSTSPRPTGCCRWPSGPAATGSSTGCCRCWPSARRSCSAAIRTWAG
ncbi:TIGR03089 family protein [Pseudonocardia benzenivorans]